MGIFGAEAILGKFGTWISVAYAHVLMLWRRLAEAELLGRAENQTKTNSLENSTIFLRLYNVTFSVTFWKFIRPKKKTLGENIMSGSKIDVEA